MASKAKRCARQEDAGQLLQQGVAPATVASIIITRFKVSRATAYRDIEAAQIVIDTAARSNPDLAPAARLDGESLVGMMETLLVQAFAEGDSKRTFQAMAALEKARKMTGLGASEIKVLDS